MNNTNIGTIGKDTEDNYEVMIHSPKEIRDINRRTKYEKHGKKNK